MSTATSTDPIEQAYEDTKAERAALSAEQLVTVNLDVPTAITTIIGVLAKIIAVRGDIVDNITHFDVKNIDNLQQRAFASVHAQGAYMFATAPPQGLAELNDRGLVLRDMFMADGNAMAKRGLVDPARLAEAKGLTGYRNVAFDLVGLTGMFRESWPQIEGRTTVQWADLDEARSVANKLLSGAGARAQAPATVSSVIDQRLRAVTLLVNAYDEVRAAVLYIRRHKGDADTITPSLYAGRGGRGKKSDAEAPVATPSAPTPATPAVPAVPHEAGMPGGSPFVT